MGVATKPLTSEMLERIRELREQGRGKIMIGRATGLHPSRVERIINKQRRNLPIETEEMRDKAQALADQGMGAKEIAEALGTSRRHAKSLISSLVADDSSDEPLAEDYEFRLVLNVLIQAARDLTARQDDIRRSARDWIMSDAYGVMSFRWICDHCDVDHRAIRRAASKPNQLRETIKAVNRRHPDSHNRRE